MRGARSLGRPRPAWLALALLPCLGACTEAESAANLEADYVLASSEAECANVTDVLLRYEDDWLPGTCVGITQRWDARRVRIEWKCRYDTNAGPTANAPIEGTLYDDDGDGTFVGTLAVRALPDVNATTLGPLGAFAFTMTPLP